MIKTKLTGSISTTAIMVDSITFTLIAMLKDKSRKPVAVNLHKSDLGPIDVIADWPNIAVDLTAFMANYHLANEVAYFYEWQMSFVVSDPPTAAEADALTSVEAEGIEINAVKDDGDILKNSTMSIKFIAPDNSILLGSQADAKRLDITHTKVTDVLDMYVDPDNGGSGWSVISPRGNGYKPGIQKAHQIIKPFRITKDSR
jgi:hypothetical protein